MLELTHRKCQRRFAIGEQPDMLIDEEFRKCVTFLFIDKADPDTETIKKEPVATAFFVAVPINGVESVIYAITTRHVINESRPYGPLYVRVNTHKGGFCYFKTTQDSWVGHVSTDVAAIRVALLPVDLDFRPIRLSMLATDEYVNRNKIGEGDDVFFAGLFTMHPGHERNQPIIRFGNISLMPHEKIAVQMDSRGKAAQIDAYLVEARSWGGQSGSPVFIYYPPDRTPGMTIVGGGPEPALLGLVQGHYDIQQPVSIGDMPLKGKVPINAGIAVVVPSQKIIELLEGEKLVEERKRIFEESRKHSVTPHPDTN